MTNRFPVISELIVTFLEHRINASPSTPFSTGRSAFVVENKFFVVLGFSISSALLMVFKQKIIVKIIKIDIILNVFFIFYHIPFSRYKPG